MSLEIENPTSHSRAFLCTANVKTNINLHEILTFMKKDGLTDGRTHSRTASRTLELLDLSTPELPKSWTRGLADSRTRGLTDSMTD